MRLPKATDQYDRAAEDQRNRALEQADQGNHKRGRDVELGPGEAVILRAPDGTRYRLEVQNGGTLATTLAED